MIKRLLNLKIICLFTMLVEQKYIVVYILVDKPRLWKTTPISYYLFSGCNSTDTEILILVNIFFYNDHKNTIEHFEKQFTNFDNIVRILKFDAWHPFLSYSLNKILLEINDKQLQPFDVVKRLEECQYSTIAENFIRSVMSFKNSSKKGLILLDTDEETKSVAKEIFEGINERTEDLAIYRIQEASKIRRNIKNEFHFVTDVFVWRWKSLTAIGAEYFSRLCTGKQPVYLL